MSPRPLTDQRIVTRDELAAAVSAELEAGGRLLLVACHEDDQAFRVVYAFAHPRGATGERRIELAVTVPRDDAWIPSLAAVSFGIGRFEREIRDQYGVRPEGHPLPHRLIRHGHWPTGWYPMLRDADPHPRFEPDSGSFPFLEVEGAGVYEIPVGPVHAGMIEPGHFRFSVVGETILRMKARLWFVHRGVEKLFEGRRPEEGVELAERISGDTAVGHALAYCMAVEEAAGLQVPEPERLLRALLLELERLHNHVTDLGALANDVGFGVVNAHAWRLRERLLRLNRSVTGHRLLRGAVHVGGCQVRELPDADELGSLAAEVQELVDVTLGHSVVRDRFDGTAVLHHEEAVALGTLGYVARASGVAIDARLDHPFIDVGESFAPVVEPGGDVRSRYLVRAREFAASTTMVMALLERLDGDRGRPAVDPGPFRPGAGMGIDEAWRGLLVHRVELDTAGRLSRVKVVDPSFFNWPALPVALADTIVPDFPLANKSFNQSYAGNDL